MATGNFNQNLIINVALTGCVADVSKNSNLPISPDAIAADVSLCAELGAQLFHLHARDKTGQPTWKRETYQEIVDKVKQDNPDVILCVSTSGRYWTEDDKRMAVLDTLGIDMASLTLGNVKFATNYVTNSPDTIYKLLEAMNERGIKPELEVFDHSMIEASYTLIDLGLLQPPYYYNLFFGTPNGLEPSLAGLAKTVKLLPDEAIWAVAGIGRYQLPMNCLAIASGGHVRTGLEDNLRYNKDILASNERLVNRLCDISETSGRELMPLADVKGLLCIA